MQKKFARENYDTVILIDFKKEPSMKKCFDTDLNVDNLVINISANKPGALFIPHKTVIILDEIQECSDARCQLNRSLKMIDLILLPQALSLASKVPKQYNKTYKTL